MFVISTKLALSCQFMSQRGADKKFFAGITFLIFHLKTLFLYSCEANVTFLDIPNIHVESADPLKLTYHVFVIQYFTWRLTTLRFDFILLVKVFCYLQGSSSKKIYDFYVIFCIKMGFGISHFSRSGQKPPKLQYLVSKLIHG